MPHTLPIADGLLLAAWGDVIGYLVVIVFVVLRYLLSEMGENKQKPQRPRPARAPQPKPVGPPQDDLRSEVDEFLRRAKGLPPREEPFEPERPRQRDRPVDPVVRDPTRPEPRRRPSGATPTRPTPAAAEPDPYRGESVEEHVSQHLRHLAESQLAENAALMGEELGQTDEKLEARLKAKFEHRLGKLEQRNKGERPSEAEPQATGLAADQIAAMLANPEGVRNAVILNEILKRPVDRW